MRIVFLGTPEFAVESLKVLVEGGKNIVGVITAPDRPAGRGRKLQMSAVKEYALSQELKVMQPTNLKAPEFLEELKRLNADLQIVVAFRMLPELVWNMPPLGTFNLHASLLPQYRGAAPINWAIMNGETKTGVSTFFLKHKIDTGEIILQDEEPISIEDNVGDLYQRLMKKGSHLVLETVNLIEKGDYSTLPQQETDQLMEAPKIFKETCKIDWSTTSEQIYNQIRGLSPYPAAFAEINGENYKIYASTIIDSNEDLPVGHMLSDGKTYLHFKTVNSFISILELQPPGKKRMKIKDFFLGNKL